MNLGLLKGFIPQIMGKLDGVGNAIKALINKEQNKHNDKFVYMIVLDQNEVPVLKGITINDRGIIAETTFENKGEEIKSLKVSELLKQLLSNV